MYMFMIENTRENFADKAEATPNLKYYRRWI